MYWFFALGVAAAAATVARALWAFLRRRQPGLESAKLGDLKFRFRTWFKSVVAHFLSKSAKRRWRIHISVDRYIQSVYSGHEKLPGGFDLPIDRCYIPLELRAGQLTEGSQLLARSGTVLLLGDPGAGKSALFSMLVRKLCRTAHDSKHRARIPICLPLQEIVPFLSAEGYDGVEPKDAMQKLTDWFEKSYAEPLDLYDSRELPSSFAQTAGRGVVVMLDGLDEISVEWMPPVEGFIVGLSRFLSNAQGSNLIIIASRRQALDSAPALYGGAIQNLVSVELRPFTPAAIYSFLLRWPYQTGYKSAEEARRIFAQLRLNPTLIETCTNPLALALYVNHNLFQRQLGPGSGGLQPETRAAFFAQVIDYLMIRTLKSAKHSNLPFRTSRISVFVSLVGEHIRSAEQFNCISERIMIKHATALARTDQTPEMALQELAKGTGLIVRNDDDATWRFIHRSFLDYFLACSMATIRSKREIDELVTKLAQNSPRYLEGFYLACGLMATRASLSLEAVLAAVGDNARVGLYYPRAALEAQAYSSPLFVQRIKVLARRLREGTERDPTLFRDLVAVLADYERACMTMGKEAGVTVAAELSGAVAHMGLSVLQAANLDVDLAMRMTNEASVAAVLVESATEDAVVALYQPEVIGGLGERVAVEQPRLAAIIAESALRSSLLSNSLTPGIRNSWRDRPRFSHRDEPWADAWPIRDSRFADVLAVAIRYVRSSHGSLATEFPHCSVLTYTRPLRRLRYELLLGDRRLLAFFVSVTVLLELSLWLLGLAMAQLVVAAPFLGLAALGAARLAVLRGVIVLPSCRILDLTPVGTEFAVAADRRVTMVTGTEASLRRWVFGRPQSAEGTVAAVYVRELPFIWRRFCPSMGDTRLRLSACAVVQQMWTEDVRRLLRS